MSNEDKTNSSDEFIIINSEIDEDAPSPGSFQGEKECPSSNESGVEIGGSTDDSYYM